MARTANGVSARKRSRNAAGRDGALRLDQLLDVIERAASAEATRTETERRAVEIERNEGAPHDLIALDAEADAAYEMGNRQARSLDRALQRLEGQLPKRARSVEDFAMYAVVTYFHSKKTVDGRLLGLHDDVRGDLDDVASARLIRAVLECAEAQGVSKKLAPLLR